MNINIVPKSVVEQIKADEGFRSSVYQCSAGKLTIGYGRNIEDNGITQKEADYLLMNDISNTHRELNQALPWFHMLSQKRKGVLINMCFNMGLPTMMKFKKMLSALSMGDYDEAARQMLDSKWARQVGDRANRLAEEMKS